MTPQRLVVKFVQWIIVVCAIATLSGCGSDNAYETIKVSGDIKYDDGSIIPAQRIELKFYSQAPGKDVKTVPKMGVTEVEVAQGTFSMVSTYDFGDGIIQGKHKVVAAAMDGKNGYLDAIPEAYRNLKTTPLTVDTTDGRKINLVIPKP